MRLIPEGHKLYDEKIIYYFLGVGMGCLCTPDGSRVYFGLGAFVIGCALSSAAWVARRRAANETSSEIAKFISES
ncbi:MAG TPA: hypothetical protein VGG19_10570 [Tepidisphaeraceae bacterium]|jgi:hypothetical protein